MAIHNNHCQLASYEKTFNNQNQLLNEFKDTIEKNNQKIDAFKLRLKDFKIIDILEDKISTGDNQGIQLSPHELISNLEKKFLQKFQLIENKIAKLESIDELDYSSDEMEVEKEVEVENDDKEVEAEKDDKEEEKDDKEEEKDDKEEEKDDKEKKVEVTFKQPHKQKKETHNKVVINKIIHKLKNELNDTINKKLEGYTPEKRGFDKDALNAAIDARLNPINKEIQKMSVNIDIAKESNKSKNDQIEKSFKDLEVLVSKSLSQIKTMTENESFFAKSKDIKDLKDEIYQKIENELEDIKMENSIQKKSYTSLKEQIINVLEDKTEQEELQNLKRKFESILSTLSLFREFEAKVQSQMENRPLFETNKFVDLVKFNEYKLNTAKDIDECQKNIDALKREFDNIINFQLKHRATFKDLKNLEDSVLTKLEDLKVASVKQYADKNDTMKNFKYFEMQIKHIEESVIKRQDKGESWLLAKKPLGGHLCGSCEAYLGELKDSTHYVPWNKYPSKEPNDKLYRIGAGFSKMLQMVGIESNSTMDKKVGNYQTIQDGYSGDKENNERQRENSAPKVQSQRVNNNFSLSSGLPSIQKHKRKINTANEFGKDEVIVDPLEEQKDEEFVNLEKPKIMKIYKKTKVDKDKEK